MPANVKLTVSFDLEQGIFFHLNHPIRFVYICGPIVAIREIFPRGKNILRYVILEIDDSSGRSIEVKIAVLKPPQQSQTRIASNTVHPTSDQPYNINDYDDEAQLSEDEAGDSFRGKKSPVERILVDTNTEKVKVQNFCDEEDCFEWHVTIANKIVDIQTVIKAKGTVTTYRGDNQLQLDRAFIVHTTDEEMRVWEEYSTFVTNVLSKPWRLDKNELRQLERDNRVKLKKAEMKEDEHRKKHQARDERHRRRRDKTRKFEEQAEAIRQNERAELDGNALDRPGWKPWPKSKSVAQRTKGG